jgi:Flp pilus assembly protein TadG
MTGIRRRRDSGQALAEFAIISPLLLLLILGMIDFARAWGFYQVITDAAREGARTVVVDWTGLTPTDKRVKAYNAIYNALGRGAIDPANARICVTKAGTSVAPCDNTDCLTEDPCTVRIELDYAFAIIGPFWQLWDPKGYVTLSTQFVMRTE